MARTAVPTTFSIVAADVARQEWGIAVHSKFPGVGAIVPWAVAGVGAIATQAEANVRFGPEGLRRLGTGTSAADLVAQMTAEDGKREHRQIGVVDATGHAAAYTGPQCLPWAGHHVGPGYAVQGNCLYSEAVVRAMGRTFENTPGDLPERLLAALQSGQREGGDRRGMQSASLLVVQPHAGYGGGNDRWIDIRVDDHASPIEELVRVFRLYDLTLLSREDPKTLLPLDAGNIQRIQRSLGVLGYLTGPSSGAFDERTAKAFKTFIAENNFENKLRSDGTIWPSILSYLESRSAQEVDRRRGAKPMVPGALDRGPGAQEEAASRRTL
ncbi:MAG: DUF1028 domain-containing protein [Thermoplasmata archaeon]|nr:DUF1028 domain-containing protein [Thermoplasmata archaeon]